MLLDAGSSCVILEDMPVEREWRVRVIGDDGNRWRGDAIDEYDAGGIGDELEIERVDRARQLIVELHGRRPS